MRLEKGSKKIKEFETWLEQHGCEILLPTNEYEVIRFKARRVGIVYMNNNNRITSFFGEAETAWEHFNNKTYYDAGNKQKRVRKSLVVRTLLTRDGTICFYCGNEMIDGEETVEHLFSINQGGKNHIANLALAHSDCNKLASHKSVVEKVKLRDQLRSKL